MLLTLYLLTLFQYLCPAPTRFRRLGTPARGQRPSFANFHGIQVWQEDGGKRGSQPPQISGMSKICSSNSLALKLHLRINSNLPANTLEGVHSPLLSISPGSFPSISYASLLIVCLNGHTINRHVITHVRTPLVRMTACTEVALLRDGK